MLHTGMTTLACILSELSPLDCLSCNALYFEYSQDYFHETIGFCRGCDKNVAALTFIPPVPCPPPPPAHKKDFFSAFGLFVKIH